jgi:MFS family permease
MSETKAQLDVRGDADAAQADRDPARTSPYIYVALFLLVLANFFNYIDRQIVSIVAQRLKTDLHLTDAQLGFLLGTAFAVFYGVVGIGMGRLADALSRTRLMAFGLAIWSGMTALAGFAGNFMTLAVARLGVGIGEAAANPCSHSLLSDYFPARNRSAAMSAYLLGSHLGAAAALIGGGLMLQHWNVLCQALPEGACRIADWRAAFLLMGTPGLLLALFIATMREPKRPLPPREGSTLGLVLREMSAAVPPLTLFNLHQAGGAGAVVRNIVFALGLAAAATAMSFAVGDWPQWAAVAIGVYSVATWAKILSWRDRPLYQLTFGCSTFLLMVAGVALTSCITGAVQAWAAPYAIRILHASPAQAGLSLGLASALVASISVIAGGLITDRWKRIDRRAPIWVTLIGVAGSVPALLVMMQAQTLGLYVAAFGVFSALTMLWPGAVAALVQDLVLPRMRGTASAAFSLMVILVASGVGPYWAGKISTLTGSLSTGLYSVMALAPIAAVLLLVAAGRLRAETAERRHLRAVEAGEGAA